MIVAEWREAYGQPNDRSGSEKRQRRPLIVEAPDATPDQRWDNGRQSDADHDDRWHLPSQSRRQDAQTDPIDPVRRCPPLQGWRAPEMQPGPQQEQAGQRRRKGVW